MGNSTTHFNVSQVNIRANTREQSNKRFVTRLKTESETEEIR